MIRELKAKLSGPSTAAFSIRILGRGEMAFYHEGGRALLVEVLAGRGIVSSSSVHSWDDGKAVTAAERETILARMLDRFRQMGIPDPEVVP